MEIRNDAEALKAFLGVSSAGAAQVQQNRGTESIAAQVEFGGDQVTLSQAGTEVALSASQEGVRADKVAAIQRALAAGTYNIPASAVADKIMNSMLADGIGASN